MKKSYRILRVEGQDIELGAIAEMTVEMQGGELVFVGCLNSGADDGFAWWVSKESAMASGGVVEQMEHVETDEEVEASAYRQLYRMAEDAVRLIRFGEMG